MRSIPLLACCSIALAFGALPAGADDLPPTSQFFDEYDTNADGKVLPDEFRGSSAVFKLLDKNGDGAISPDELGLPADYKPKPRRKDPRAGGEAPAKKDADPRRAARREEFRRRLAVMDANKDGRVSKDEWQGPEQAFARLDRNQDGFLDAKDTPQRRPGGAPKGGDRKGGARKGEGRRPDPAAAEALKERAKGHFARLDKDGDGKLTSEESPNAQLLEMADADKDGAVTLEEFLAAVQKRMRGRAPGKGRDGDRRRRGGRISAGMLRRWDRNQDGKVSAEEFPGRDELFARLDADKDGFLTEADVEAARKRRDAAPQRDAPTTTPKSGNVIEQQDRDGDGRLNRAEFQGSNSVWRLLDRNGDGWITADELKPAADR